MALVLAALGSADAATQPKPQHAKREQPKKEPPPKPLDMPLIEVSISKQQLTLYEMGEPIAHAPVSTGMAGHSTPTGIFSVIGKEVFHRSNIYSGAPMPFMQRITWSGVALHAGVLPGYPASHGCIRMPHEFAVRLFRLTRLGARVLVLPHEVAPLPFESAKLFTKATPATDKTADAILPALGAADAKPVHVVRTAESQTPSVMSDAVDAAAHALAGMAKPNPAPAAAGPVEPAKAGGAPDATTAGPAGGATTGTVLVKPVQVTPPQPIEVRKTFDPVGTPRAATQTFEPAPMPPAAAPAPLAAAQPAEATPPPASQALPAQTAQPAPAPETRPAPAATAAAASELYGPERPLRAGPITVFVSKKEGKLFVRKGFQPVFSWPVKFEHPELPVGTHLYTAVDANPDNVSFRWQVVSLPVDTSRKAEKHVRRDKKGHHVETVTPAVALPAATAAEALERIDIPEVALTRISALMSRGASLIISDKGLGGETGTETDFIVLTR